MPASDPAPSRYSRWSQGLFRPKPRMSFKSSAWQFIYTTPASKNSVSFTSEWFIIYSTVPWAANAFSSPRRLIMLTPTRINPIWLSDEQAKMCFKLVLNTAITAPSTMVTVPSTSSKTPHRSSPGRMLAVIISTPSIPALVSTPLSRAEAGAGATGCALGSQMCRGKAPALAAKPKKMHSAAAHSARRFSTAAQASFRAAVSSVPVR